MRSFAPSIQIAAPFGGLQRGANLRDVNPRNATDCLNIVTHEGNIARRPGSLLIGGPAFANWIRKLASVAIGESRYLYAFDQFPASGYHHLIDGALTDFSAPAACADIPAVIPYGNLLLCVSGQPSESRKLYKSGGSLTHARLGIEPPAGAPVPLVLIAGSLTGTFSYRYTFYNSNTGTESGPSPEGSTTAAAQGVRVTLPASADAQVTHKRIYRKQDGVDATWYFLAQTAASTYDDTAGAVDRSADGELNFAAGYPPRSHIATAHRGSIWYKDETDGYRGSSVIRSEFGRPEQCHATSVFRFGSNPADPLYALWSMNGVLWGLNARSIWAVTGFDRSSYVTERVTGGCGCAAPESLVEHEGWLYFVGPTAIYRFNGQQAECISMPDDPAASRLGPLSELVHPDDIYYIVGVYEPVTHSIAFFARDRAAGGWQQLVYNVRTRVWWRWNIAASAAAWHDADGFVTRAGGMVYLGTHAIGNGGHLRLAVLGTPSQVDTPVYTDFTGASPAWRWRTPPLALGVGRRKRWAFAGICWRGGAANATLRLSQSGDGEADRQVLSVAQDRTIKRGVARLGTRSVDLAVQIDGIGGDKQVEIQQIDLDAEPADRR